MEQEATKKAEEFLEHVNKTYGLSLSQITVVKINEKEYLKFYEPDSNTIKMIENGSQNLNEYFKELQQKLSFAKSNNELNNAKNIFEYEEKYVRSSIKLISIMELETNFNRYTLNLSEEKIRQLAFLVKNAKALDIAYINVESGMYVNNNQETLYIEKDQITGKSVIKKAEAQVYEDKKVKVDEDNYQLDVDGINFDEVVEGIDITVPNDEPLIIAGETIDLNTLSNYIQYPELLERQVESQQITQKRKTIIQYLIEAYQRKLTKKQNTNNKVLVLRYPDKAAFIDAFLLAILSSTAAIIIAMVVYF